MQGMIDAMCRSMVLVPVLLGAVLFTAGCHHSAVAASPPVAAPSRATAGPVQPDPHVGAVFLGDSTTHACAAAVLHSKTGDLILTAAHCLAAIPDSTFVPGFDGGDPGAAARWRVSAVYLDPRWLANHDPLADYAIARVGRSGAGSLEAVTGSGLAVGNAPQPGSVVTVTAYALGSGGPIGCRSTTALGPGGFPSVQCGGLVDGTSGAPWISGPAVVGLIGGLHGGGCDDKVSYSPPFDGGVLKLLTRAEARGPADTQSQTLPDDCT